MPTSIRTTLRGTPTHWPTARASSPSTAKTKRPNPNAKNGRSEWKNPRTAPACHARITCERRSAPGPDDSPPKMAPRTVLRYGCLSPHVTPTTSR